MIKSMTAFGRGKVSDEEKDVTVELHSVNSRFLDFSVRLPRGYAYLEEPIKNYVQKNLVSRGKVEITVTVTVRKTPTVRVTPDEGYLKGYLDALYRLRDEYGLRDDISVMTVAQNPAVFLTEQGENDTESDKERVFAALEEAGKEYTAMREAEGRRTAEDFRRKLETIRSLAREIGEASAADIRGYRAKLEERLRKILADNEVTADENRILTECAIMADKLAVDEELVRLGSHIAAFEEILSGEEPAGRKLDFLMQEMNREANTAGSKCCNAEIA
ncbi:MAG: YicC family protein, partial [Clostridia bacterium]|nr:YicC family protein [Clostridia bacterium]